MFCTNCGREIAAGSAVCVYCGARLSGDLPQGGGMPQQGDPVRGMPRPAPKKKRGRGLIAVLGIVFALALLFGAAVLGIRALRSSGAGDTLRNVPLIGSLLQSGGEDAAQDDTGASADAPVTIVLQPGADSAASQSTQQDPSASAALQKGDRLQAGVSESSSAADVPEASPEASAVPQQTPEPTPEPTPTPTPEPEYLLPTSDSAYLTAADLAGLTWEECCLARNEIYARHHRIFSTPAIAAYFEGKSWYSGTVPAAAFSTSVLNEYERANVSTIAQYEKEHWGGSYY